MRRPTHAGRRLWWGGRSSSAGPLCSTQMGAILLGLEALRARLTSGSGHSLAKSERHALTMPDVPAGGGDGRIENLIPGALGICRTRLLPSPETSSLPGPPTCPLQGPLEWWAPGCCVACRVTT